MRNVLIISSVFGFTFFKSQNISYHEVKKNKSFKIFNVDINNDGIKDKVVCDLKGNELLFFTDQNGNYESVYEGDNFSMDGIYLLKEVKSFKEDNNILYLKNIFNGAGGEIREYFYTYENKTWRVSKSITSSFDFQSNKICIQNLKTTLNTEKCFSYSNLDGPENTLKELISKLEKEDNLLTKEFTYSIISSYPISNKNLKIYNQFIRDLEIQKKYNIEIFLIKKVLEKFPKLAQNYLNLADAQWQTGEKANAKASYQKYISLMKSKEKKSQKIPERVYERIK